jgi:NADH-quinone oxidoreductase subunit F
MNPVKVILEHDHLPDVFRIGPYMKAGGYEALRHVIQHKLQNEVVEEVKKSGLRGRGGAGFPTGMKWSFLPPSQTPRGFLIDNADEGEPGTFKDRYILNRHPHKVIEGMVIAAYALNIPKSYHYIRGEFRREAATLQKAMEEAYTKGFLGDRILGSDFSHHMVIHMGAGAYICGEETGLISSLEGKKGQPKLKPPFPAVQGFLGKPTVVNNTETFAAVPYIVREGAEVYRSLGTEKSPGTKLFSVSGRVNKPGVYELPLGTPLMTLLNDSCEGMQADFQLKGVIPGGISAGVLTADECLSATLDYECLANLKSMLGSGGVIVIDHTQSMVDIATITARFFHHESCGQCTPCREGTGWLEKVLDSVHLRKGSSADIDLALKICEMMMGKTICAFSDAAAMPTISYIRKFRHEFESLVNRRV